MIIVYRLLHRVGGISDDLARINIKDEYDQITQHRNPTQMTQLVGNINVSLDMLDRERQFASTVAHEIRSPLAGIRISVEEAIADPDHADYPGAFREVLWEVDRLEALATDLLLIARGRIAQNKERIDLCELVRQEVAARADLITVEVSCTCSGQVEAMHMQMREILTNLLDNARRHARHSVRVDVGCGDSFARLAVSDDGPGIPSHERERVFDRLYQLTTESRRGDAGSGLGLSIVREIVKTHNGSVWVEPSPSGGARFVVQLPLAPSPASTA
ncbi:MULTISPECIES: HAMP domain-containing sensor histidine kinase [unclassified Microbispora]|uniref:sensor histidine kinase n=1 Tax=unclassified Microbispora TaxID=2614687 RepID=UPI0014399C95|nr:HAMP domain-containing sensor histidine kinase [Microbispora sp. SCL1-1]NJP27200.1 HAMP domain-containing histidine kinase [Microbispora sp. CL1-1]